MTWNRLPVSGAPWWLVLLGLALLPAASTVTTTLLGLTGGAIGPGAALCVQMGLLAAAGLWAVRRWTGPRSASRLARTLAVAAGGTALFTALSLVWEARDPAHAAASAEVIRSFGFGASPANDLAIVLGVTLLAPLGEEAAFRGLVFRPLRDVLARRGAPAGIALLIATAVSAVAFADIHSGGGQDAQLPMLALLGVILALAYAATGTLLAPVLIHAANNAIALAQGFAAAGLESPSPWLLLLGPALILARAVLRR